MGILLLFAVMQVAVVGLVTAGCPVVCVCPAGPPSCSPGVSSVPDGCGCCKVCAAQLNQDCHEGRPCDHHKGLECNYGNDVGRTHGICRAKAEGRSCEYNGRIYQNGENFRAGCKHQCTCIDGAVGCVPLCPSHVPLASPSCPAPQLVKVPGQCCLSIDCNKGTTFVPPVHRRPQPPAYPPYPFIPYPAYRYPKPYPKPYQKLYPYKPKKEKETMGNELVEVGHKWDKPRGNKHLAAWRQMGDQCVIQTTSWSQCSRSCGMGVSSRVTNDNARCKLIKETRLCNIRPCSSMSIPVKKGRKCSRTHKAPEPHRLSYASCRSTRLYRPNYCGVCRDGRCCSPRRTRTAGVTFACPDGERFSRSMMFIQSCKCSHECNHLNEAAMPPQRWLYGDTHKFVD
ncbi:CCN family member 1 isoform X1 [Xiphias gladius]|uniref:CCN family member 1 isoform X1 n=1 Tax=Xiphias gladius TaxID=8245 RepID=UPI001A99CEC0|nr:CCN family member 1 isoform X1 [Xiphias gladius]